MTEFGWSDDLASGNPVLDDEHRQLIKRVNAVGAAMASGEDNTVVRTSLNELIGCAASHFEREEELMQKIAYWAYLPHKADHDALIGELVALRLRFEAGALLRSSKVHSFLTEWVATHTRTSDKLLGAAARKAAAAAMVAAGSSTR